MKKLSVLVTMLTLSCVVLAAPVGRQQARQKAVAFLKQQNFVAQISEKAPIRAKSAAVTVDQSPYYIFNLDGNKGFIIVSGDDRAEEILGYADEGSFDAENIPDGLQALLDQYEAEIRDLDDSELLDDATARARKAMAKPRSFVEPFCTRYWSQGSPHNLMIPVYNGKNCTAGCLGVAVAEAMGCLNWPEESKAIPGYTTPTGNVEVSALEATTFDWDNICDIYHGTDEKTDEQKEAVAKFVRYVTQAIQTNYPATTAYLSKVPAAMKEYFDYDESVTYIDLMKTTYSYLDLIDLLYNEVANHRPVLHSGFSTATNVNNAAGHAYVIDGYDKDDFFHIEWGWWGYCKGFYRLSALNAYKNVRNRYYNNKAAIVIGIQPKGQASEVTEEDTQDYSLTLNSVSVSTSTTASTSTNIVATLANNNKESAYFDHAVALYDTDYNMLNTVKEFKNASFSSGSSRTIQYTVSFTTIPDGTYYLIPVSRVKGSTDWLVNRCNGTNAYVKAVVADGTGVCSFVPACSVNSMAIDEADRNNPCGAPQEIHLSLTNNTFDVMYKDLYLFTGNTMLQHKLVRIPVLSTVDTNLTAEFDAPGNYTLKVTTDYYGRNMLAANLTLAATATEAIENPVLKGTLVTDNLGKKVDNTGYLYADNYTTTVKVTNTGEETYNDYIRLALTYQNTAYVGWVQTEKYHIRLAPGESQKFSFESEKLMKNIEYGFRAYSKSSTNSNIDNPDNCYLGVGNGTDRAIYNRSLVFLRADGTRYWTSDGKEVGVPASESGFTVPENAVAVSFDTTTVPASITENSNPNTLYYFKEAADFDNLTNVIVDGVAEEITLEDGYPCLVPIDFTAGNISYTRTFTKGYQGEGTASNWSTIVLPFEVQTITNKTANKVIDWFHSDTDRRKQFWMRKFYGCDGRTVYFDYTDKMEANIPYIIAVPDRQMGSAFNLVNKEIEFSATDAAVKAGNMTMDAPNRNFVGTTTGQVDSNVFAYLLDENGENFTYTADVTETSPFTAYFTSDYTPIAAGARLVIAMRGGFNRMEGDTDAIRLVSDSASDKADIYGINGAKVGKIDASNVREVIGSLPAGVYIINGKKYVK